MYLNNTFGRTRSIVAQEQDSTIEDSFASVHSTLLGFLYALAMSSSNFQRKEEEKAQLPVGFELGPLRSEVYYTHTRATSLQTA